MEIVNSLTEECFCLKYELDALAEISLRNESERWIPGFIHQITEQSHIKRYELASQFAKDKIVLDIACGAGKGSNTLVTSGQAKYVTGCDIQEDAIRYAKHRSKHEKATFEVQNAETYSKKNFYDLVVSFETIEHLNNYQQFISNVQRSLKENGVFIVSTPISNVPFNEKPTNPYHMQEWGFLEFQKLLANCFTVEKVFVQLYQNAFLNEKITDDLKRKNPLKTIVKNGIRKLISKPYKKPIYYNDWNTKSNYPSIEEFTHQYSTDKLGKDYVGYQIVICKSEKNNMVPLV